MANKTNTATYYYLESKPYEINEQWFRGARYTQLSTPLELFKERCLDTPNEMWRIVKETVSSEIIENSFATKDESNET